MALSQISWFGICFSSAVLLDRVGNTAYLYCLLWLDNLEQSVFQTWNSPCLVASGTCPVCILSEDFIPQVVMTGFPSLLAPKGVVPDVERAQRGPCTCGLGLQNLGMSQDGCAGVCVSTQQAWASFFILSCSFPWQSEGKAWISDAECLSPPRFGVGGIPSRGSKPLVTLGSWTIVISYTVFVWWEAGVQNMIAN